MSGVEVGSVYVHAPFCARRCFYCDFAVTVDREPDPEPWLRAIERELQALEAEGLVRLAPRLETLYVGGGTPSLLRPEAMEELGRLLTGGPGSGDRLSMPGLEWTAEANPESLTPSVAAGWRRAGVNRVSLGTQSFQEPVLRWMGRLHGPHGTAAAVAVARDAGFETYSVDLIFGLPAAVERDWSADLDAALALEPPHVSLYGLTADTGTPLGRAVGEGRIRMVEEARYDEEYLEAAERLAAEGYEHYEVSNFARPGHRSRHNQAYWSGVPYLGLGNGAHSFVPPTRRWNVREWADYACLTGGPSLPVDESETVEGASRRLEDAWLGLRCDRGLPVRWSREGSAGHLVATWEESGWAEVRAGRLTLTPRGWLLLDRLAIELHEALERESRRG
ncbi:MAG: radical SAM family heme chaperone HemW [Gemmatimonadetes bacterium]|nr:radical SAM family heme chaperone HemW [Gemmatimonadota bacterium]